MSELNFYFQTYKKIILISLSVLISMIALISFFLINKKYNKEETITDINLIAEEKNTNNDESNIEETIKIDIKGYVTIPGVYELKENDRVIDAINMAGGLLENANTRYLNLSKRLNDESVIIINSNDEIEELLKKEVKESIPCEPINNACLKEEKIITSNKEAKDSSKTSSNNKEESTLNTLVNINTADVNELMTLKGIGEAKALKIIEYRNTSGFFEKIEDIKNVSGIGTSIYEKIKNNITV